MLQGENPCMQMPPAGRARNSVLLRVYIIADNAFLHAASQRYIHIYICGAILIIAHFLPVKLCLTAFCVMNTPSPCVITVAWPYCLSSSRICQRHRFGYHCAGSLIKQSGIHCSSLIQTCIYYIQCSVSANSTIFMLSLLFDCDFSYLLSLAPQFFIVQIKLRRKRKFNVVLKVVKLNFLFWAEFAFKLNRTLCSQLVFRQSEAFRRSKWGRRWSAGYAKGAKHFVLKVRFKRWKLIKFIQRKDPNRGLRCYSFIFRNVNFMVERKRKNLNTLRSKNRFVFNLSIKASHRVT